MRKLSILFLFFSLYTHAQNFEYGELQQDGLRLNSVSSVKGMTRNTTRNFAEFTIPKNCIGYIYRLSVVEKGSAVENLTKALQYVPKKEVKVGAKLGKLILNNNNSNDIDFFIFDNEQSAKSFVAKESNNYCKQFINRINVCKYSEECMQGSHIYFAFRNNNIANAVEISLEFMPLIRQEKVVNNTFVWESNYQKALKRAKQEHKPILVNFTGSDWCGWCIKLKREVFSQENFKEYAKKNLVLLTLDFPKKKTLPSWEQNQNQKLAQKYGVKGFPTVLLLDNNEKLLFQTGYQRGGAENYIKHLKKNIN